MERPRFDIVFAVIAPREVDFFSRVAGRLRAERGRRCAFITFYEPGDAVLKAQGYSVFSPHREADLKNCAIDAEWTARFQAAYGVKDIRDLIRHEKLVFARFDEERLLRKLAGYTAYFERILRENEIACVAQELGGFIAPLSLYYVCRSKSVRHIFFEPAMYKGRLLLNVDTMDNAFAEGLSGEEAKAAVRRYIEAYHRDKTVVMPDKDRHHFKDAGWRKLLTARNIKRLAQKLYYKYILRRREEYDAIGTHVGRALRAVFTRRKFAKFYQDPAYGERYVYYPLHVPLDFQLTVREERYLDQPALLEFVAGVLPAGCKLYVKEHPASIGAYDYAAMRRLLAHDNVRFIHPKVNSYDLVKNAAAVLTINSKVGAEALMQGKKVLVLGSPYYAAAQGAVKLYGLEALKGFDWDAFAAAGPVDYGFFEKIYTASQPGELYNNEPENVESFSRALESALMAPTLKV